MKTLQTSLLSFFIVSIATHALANPTPLSNSSFSINYHRTSAYPQRKHHSVLQTYIPLYGSVEARHIISTDVRFKQSFSKSDEINLGIGHRFAYGSSYWLGYYGFIDHMQFGNTKGFWQTTLGIEALHPHHFFRLNSYIPQSSAVWLHQNAQDLSLKNRTLILQEDGIQPAKGFDVELGPRISMSNHVLKIHLGGRRFQRTDSTWEHRSYIGASVSTAATNYLPQINLYTSARIAPQQPSIAWHAGVTARFFIHDQGKKNNQNIAYTPIERDPHIIIRPATRTRSVPIIDITEHPQTPLHPVSWQSDFSTIDALYRDWDIETWPEGQFNEELQAYTQDTANGFVQNGHLVIRAIKDAHGRITSARITTQYHRYFQYGKLVVRARLPMQQGTWPAIWLLGNTIHQNGWPEAGEIDIMEHVNDETSIKGSAHDANHCWKSHVKNQEFDQVVPHLDQAHDYGLTWTPDYLEWSVDGHAFGRLYKTQYTGSSHAHWAYDDPQFLLLNLAIGGLWPGAPRQDFQSSDMAIESVTYQQLNRSSYKKMP